MSTSLQSKAGKLEFMGDIIVGSGQGLRGWRIGDGSESESDPQHPIFSVCLCEREKWGWIGWFALCGYELYVQC